MRMPGTCVLALLLLAPVAGAACPRVGHDATTLRESKAGEFALVDASGRQRPAVALLPTVLRNCTGMSALFLVPGAVLVLAERWRGRAHGAVIAT